MTQNPSQPQVINNSLVFRSNDQNNETEFDLNKKESLKKITERTELFPTRSSKSIVTKNILNEQEEVIFETGLKMTTLNPEKIREQFGKFDMMYEPGKKKKGRATLPPLKKEQHECREEIMYQKGHSPFLPIEQSSSSIVLKSNREEKVDSGMKKQPEILIYQFNPESVNIRSFVYTPIPQGLTLQCTIRRDRSTCAKKLYTQYTLQVSNNFHFLLAAKRLPFHCNSTYSISLEMERMKLGDDCVLAQVKSNFWGSLFEILDYSGQRAEPKIIGTVQYDSSCCQGSTPRTMNVDIVNISGPRSEPSEKNMRGSSTSTVVEDLVTELTTKKPRYDERKKAYVMKFGSRVKRPSIKNFILVRKETDEKNITLFGKVSKGIYSLDICHPMTPIQAFAIALSSFDSKLISQ